MSAAAATTGATARQAAVGGVGELVADLEISRAWLVDPAAGREGPGELVVTDGVIEAVNWLEGSEAGSVDDRGIVVAPGLVDLHAHLREPGDEDAETIASGLAAAAHGGFTTVGIMADTTPPLDEPSVLARIRAAAAASSSPVEVLAHGTISAGLRGETLAAIGELADAGVVGFSDDASPVRSATILRNALAYAGMFGLPVVSSAEDATLTAGAEANEGLPATVLGLRGWPAAAEVSAVARDLAILEDVWRDSPRARLHLAHLSTAEALDLVRRAKAAGLPVTCDVAPHHLALTDGWLAGWRRWAWEDAWAPGAAVEAAPYASSLRVVPPLRSAGDAAACRAALADGTADAMASSHAPRTIVDKELEFGLAAPGISSLETALGVVMAAVDAGELPLGRAIEALTTGPVRVLGARPPRIARGLVEGAIADLVVFDRGDSWIVTPDSLASKGRNTPLVGRALPGRVLVTVAAGRLAYSAD